MKKKSKKTEILLFSPGTHLKERERSCVPGICKKH